MLIRSGLQCDFQLQWVGIGAEALSKSGETRLRRHDCAVHSEGRVHHRHLVPAVRTSLSHIRVSLNIERHDSALKWSAIRILDVPTN